MSTETSPSDLDPGLDAHDQQLDLRRGLERQARRQRILRGAVGICAALLLWQVLSVAYDITTLLPTPWTVAKTLFSALTLQEGWQYGDNIYVQAGHSLLLALLGFSIAALVGIPLGLLMGRVTLIRDLLDPLVKSLFPIPGIAWIPLAILWFGLGSKAILFIIFTGCFFPILFNVAGGARSVDALLIDAARCYGARGTSLFLRCIVPATVPSLVTGLRIAVGESWRGVVAGEIVAGQNGIGFLLSEARFYFRADDLLAGMVVISFIGFSMEKIIVGTLERRTISRWERSSD